MTADYAAAYGMAAAAGALNLFVVSILYYMIKRPGGAQPVAA